MQAASSLLVPCLLAAFIAILCLPPLNWLTRHNIPAAAAILLIAMALLLAGGLTAAFAGASVADFSRNLPAYQARLNDQTASFLAWAAESGLDVNSQLLRASLDPSAVMGMAGKLLAGLGNALTNTFLIVLTVICLLVEAIALPNKWAAMGQHAPSTTGFESFVKSVNAYMAIKVWVSLATGAMISIWLIALDVDYPLLWGLLAFLFNFVPNIGSIIAAIPAILLALVQLGPPTAIGVGVGYLAVNLIIGQIVEPRFMGKGVGLSTLVVFISLIFWGWVLGPVGMLLSVPLTMVVKLALETRQDTCWIAVLLGPDIEPDQTGRR